MGVDDDGGMGMVTEGSVATDTGDSVATGGVTDAAGDSTGADAEERRRDGRKGWRGLAGAARAEDAGVEDDDCGN